MLIADTGADADEERRALATLSRQVDGLVSITPITDLSTVTCPVVQVNRQSAKVVSVVVDQRSIAVTAIDHLTTLGHTSIAVVRGPAAVSASVPAKEAWRTCSGPVNRVGIHSNVLTNT